MPKLCSSLPKGMRRMSAILSMEQSFTRTMTNWSLSKISRCSHCVSIIWYRLPAKCTIPMTWRYHRCTDPVFVDAYWLYPQSPGDRAFEAGSFGRNVLPETTGTGKTDKTSCSCHSGSLEAIRCRGGHGIQPSLHGHERSTKVRRKHNNELYARIYAVKRQNQRGVPKPPQ